jgi:hypothetical protein
MTDSLTRPSATPLTLALYSSTTFLESIRQLGGCFFPEPHSTPYIADHISHRTS